MVIFFDNNATTVMPNEAKKAMLLWSNRGNPSASYAVSAQQLLTQFKGEILKLLGDNASQYDVIITSGASESNCSAVRGVIDHWWLTRRQMPHIVMSTIEHKSLLLVAEQLVQLNRIEITYVKPNNMGFVEVTPVVNAIRGNTALVCVMHANNETGAINDVVAIGKATAAKRTLLLCDSTQAVRWGFQPTGDIITMSMHKMHGPPGVGVICKRKTVGMLCTICGTQNDGLRGGTENIPGIGAALVGLRINMSDRPAKNVKLAALRKQLIDGLAARVPLLQYSEYMTAKHKKIECVLISGVTQQYVPNTLLISIAKRGGAPVCNTNVKRILEKRGILVSIGSACNTKSDKASHVLYEMGADEYIRRGTLRISIGDENTHAEIASLIRELVLVIADINTY